MEINPIAGGSSSTATATSSAARVDYDAFLRLLVAEINNQDPTQPMDSTEYVAQLASFSQVEQSIQTNSKLDQMLSGNALLLAEALIGRTITSPSGDVEGTVASVRYADGDAAVATLADGQQVALTSGVSIS